MNNVDTAYPTIERELVNAARRYVRARRRTWMLVPAPVVASLAIASPLWVPPNTVSFTLTAVWFCGIVAVAAVGFGGYAFEVGRRAAALTAYYRLGRLRPDVTPDPDDLLARDAELRAGAGLAV